MFSQRGLCQMNHLKNICLISMGQKKISYGSSSMKQKKYQIVSVELLFRPGLEVPSDYSISYYDSGEQVTATGMTTV